MNDKKEKKPLAGADVLCSYLTGGAIFTLVGILLYNELGGLEFGGSFKDLAGQAFGVLFCMVLQEIAGMFGKVIYEWVARSFFPDKQNYVWGAVRILTVFAITMAACWIASVR